MIGNVASADAFTDPDAASRTNRHPNGTSLNDVGSYQQDEFESHNHIYGAITGGPSFGAGGGLNTAAAATSNTGGNETRMRNAYVNYIIKY
jgi:hypothetical protein